MTLISSYVRVETMTEPMHTVTFTAHVPLYQALLRETEKHNAALSHIVRAVLVDGLKARGENVPMYVPVRSMIPKRGPYVSPRWRGAVALLPPEGFAANRWWGRSQMPHSSFHRMVKWAVAAGEAEKRSDGLYYRVMPMTQNGNEVPVRDPSTT